MKPLLTNQQCIDLLEAGKVKECIRELKRHEAEDKRYYANALKVQLRNAKDKIKRYDDHVAKNEAHLVRMAESMTYLKEQRAKSEALLCQLGPRKDSK